MEDLRMDGGWREDEVDVLFRESYGWIDG